MSAEGPTESSQLLNSDNMPIKQNNLTSVHLVLCSIQLSFSGWHIVGAIALKEGANPLIFALYREVLASIFMYCFMKYGKEKLRVDSRDRARFIFLGFCSFINVVGTVLALEFLSATRYAMMQPTIPVISTCMSVALGLETLNIFKAFGIVLAVSGALLVELWSTGSSDDDGDSNVTLGSIIVAVQVTGMASLIVFQKPLLNRYKPATLTTVYYSIGSFITVLACIGWSYTFDPDDFVFGGELFPWVGLAYATIFSTVYAYNAYSWAGKQVSPAITTVYNTLQPVGTALLSFAILGVVITLSEVVGGVLVICGLVVTVYGRSVEEAVAAEGEKAFEENLLEGYDIVDKREMTLGSSYQPPTLFSGPSGGSAQGAVTEESDSSREWTMINGQRVRPVVQRLSESSLDSLP